MTQYIKKVKFSGTLKDFDYRHTEYEQSKSTQEFITDVISECGKIKKSFYWLQKYPANSRSGDQLSFEVKYTSNVGEIK